jgi:hypothetical protein
MMAATNTDVSEVVPEEVLTLGVSAEENAEYAAGEELLSEVEEDDFPSASEIAAANTVVTLLADLLAS